MNAVLRLHKTSMAQISIAQNYLTHGRPSLGLDQCDYTADIATGRRKVLSCDITRSE
jgi:hypothetical protein